MLKNKLVKEFFPELSLKQQEKLEVFAELIKEWNAKINLISRKDIEQLEENHLLPALSYLKACPFVQGSKLLDVGTGGGLPGIPLAIAFPEVEFLLVDSVGKKIKVVESIVEALGLKNVRTLHARIEDVDEKFDFVLGRAVANLPRFIGWVRKNIRKGAKNPLSNGILYLKGGQFEEELEGLKLKPSHVFNLEDYFGGKYCQEKCLVHFSKEDLDKLV